MAVPSGQLQVLVEHHDAIAHVFESDPQFCLALADFAEESCILHCDDSLCGEILQQRNLFIAEWFHFLTVQHERAEQLLVFAECNPQCGASAEAVCKGATRGPTN